MNSPAAIDAGVDNEAPAGAITVIVNRKSGSGAEAQRKAITEAFARAKLDAHIRVVDGADIRATAERAAAAGHTLVAAGGDGTVSTVASVAVASGATFGVLPLGTLNHFAKDAGIPLEIGPAVAVIAGGHIVALDTGAINGRTFVNNASLGFYANLVRERQIEQRRGTSKWIAFALGLFRGWTHYRQMRVHMKVDGRPLVRRTPFVFIGNGDYQDEGLDLGRRISLTTGHLCIYLAPECGRLEMLVLLLRALAGRLTPDVKLESFVAADATIDPTRHGRHLAMDGELVIVPPPLQAVSRPGTLRTLLPR